MILSPSANRTRMAIDNRVNRDLVAQARAQGFVFSEPPADYPIWQQVETADLENPVYDCTPSVSDWLLSRAVEATLFLIYLQERRSKLLATPAGYHAQKVEEGYLLINQAKRDAFYNEVETV